LLLISHALRVLDPDPVSSPINSAPMIGNRNENVTNNVNTNHSQWVWSLAPIGGRNNLMEINKPCACWVFEMVETFSWRNFGKKNAANPLGLPRSLP
jgi:hypothetical protein